VQVAEVAHGAAVNVDGHREGRAGLGRGGDRRRIEVQRRGEQGAGDVERRAARGAEEPVVTDLHEPSGEDVLKEPREKAFGRKGAAFGLVAL